MKYIPSEDENLFVLNSDIFVQGISVDCVIIGFHDNNLKILLNKFEYIDDWMLPGGFVYKGEDVNESAYRVLSTRTGLKDTFLRQFYTFGDCNRVGHDESIKIVERNIDHYNQDHWFLQRFITVGYYALVEYSKVEVSVDDPLDQTKWFALDEIPKLYGDHNEILNKALSTLRQEIDYIPFGYELLPDKFALSELRVVYETISNKHFDRRNFQRKIMSLSLLDKQEEIKKEKGRRSTSLYSFNKEKYKDALENGISLVNW